MSADLREIRLGPMTWGEYRTFYHPTPDGVVRVITGRTALTESQVDAMPTDDVAALFKRVCEVIQREVNLQMLGNELKDILPGGGKDASEPQAAT